MNNLFARLKKMSPDELAVAKNKLLKKQKKLARREKLLKKSIQRLSNDLIKISFKMNSYLKEAEERLRNGETLDADLIQALDGIKKICNTTAEETDYTIYDAI